MLCVYIRWTLPPEVIHVTFSYIVFFPCNRMAGVIHTQQEPEELTDQTSFGFFCHRMKMFTGRHSRCRQTHKSSDCHLWRPSWSSLVLGSHQMEEKGLSLITLDRFLCWCDCGGAVSGFWFLDKAAPLACGCELPSREEMASSVVSPLRGIHADGQVSFSLLSSS